MRRIGIIGAGRFGLSLAESLAEAGQEVLLLDRNGSLVQKARDIVEKELGIETVVAKATSELHGKILQKIGADQVIFPDHESAHRLARSLANRGAFDLLEISEGCSIAEINVPESCVDKTLAQADLRNKTGVTVLCIRRQDENPKKPRAIMIPGPNDQIHADDKLIVFGTTKQIDELNAQT